MRLQKYNLSKQNKIERPYFSLEKGTCRRESKKKLSKQIIDSFKQMKSSLLCGKGSFGIDIFVLIIANFSHLIWVFTENCGTKQRNRENSEQKCMAKSTNCRIAIHIQSKSK